VFFSLSEKTANLDGFLLSDAEKEGLAGLCEMCEVEPKADRRGRYCESCSEAALTRRVSRRGRPKTAAQLEMRKIRERRRRRYRPEQNVLYGSEHKRLREAFRVEVEAGNCRCARCGLPILVGQRWDLGHVDGDRSRYAGAEHASSSDCPLGGNRATARRDRRFARASR
jgi:hypothetical protein